MSDNSVLRARLARLALVQDVSRPPLSSEDSVTVLLHRTGKLDQPIALTRRLFAAGQTLKGAHGVVNRLAADGSAVCAVVKDTDLPALARDLAAMNVRLSRM